MNCVSHCRSYGGTNNSQSGSVRAAETVLMRVGELLTYLQNRLKATFYRLNLNFRYVPNIACSDAGCSIGKILVYTMCIQRNATAEF